MSMAGERETDAVTGTETTGHEWDGIKELNTPLPRWWLYIFYGTIAWSIVYWVLMPAWPGLTGYTSGVLHMSDRAAVAHELAALQTQRGAGAARLAGASLEQIEKDPELLTYALAVGGSIFGDNCATCHGAGGTGAKAYPNLRDDVWLWGGSLEQIQQTITHGVRSGDPQAHISQMPAFGRDQMLDPGQVSDLTEYVVSLSGRPASATAVARAAPLYRDQCAACHGPDGKGTLANGAPNLTDREWLYGSDRASIREQIFNGRGGVMPAWNTRYDPNTIKALAVYIHANAAGQ
jgi:cytochrome c oxidase cbb3-type subunit 3